MRFANLCDHNSTSINIGDYLQFLMIDALYEKLSIDHSKIKYLRGEEISTYQGEKLLLPINFISTIFVQNNQITFSEDIIPVFISLSFSNMKEKLDIKDFFKKEINRNFLYRFSPIGCRDEYTYSILKEHGIPAYLNGCLTATLPKRKSSKRVEKVFLADTPLDLLPYIPRELLKKAEIVSQQACFSEEEIIDYKRVFQFVKNRYQSYRDEAKLVITSRLHVAVPCSAMGIPVVFAKDYIDTRFSWCDKLFPLYSKEKYSTIDWAPLAPDFEEQKKRMMDYACQRVVSVYEQENKQEQLTSFFQTREKLETYYNSHDITHRNTGYLTMFLKRNEKDKQFTYGIWGITRNTDFWINLVSKKYPNSSFVCAFDSYKKGYYHGIEIRPFSANEMSKIDFIFIDAVSVVPYARNEFKRLNLKKERYIFLADSFIQKEDVES